MLVKNFNNLIAYKPFNLQISTDAQKAQMLTGDRININSDYWTSTVSPWKGDANQSDVDGVALILSTSTQPEDINTYLETGSFPNPFAKKQDKPKEEVKETPAYSNTNRNEDIAADKPIRGMYSPETPTNNSNQTKPIRRYSY